MKLSLRALTATAAMTLALTPRAAHAQSTDPRSSAAARATEWTSLRLMRDKGVISEAEYASAMKDLGAQVGAGDANTFVLSKWSATLYGFAQADFMYHTTESCQDFCSNAQIARSPAYQSSHGRTIFSIRDSRFGVRIATPEESGVRASGTIETDFFGAVPPTSSEQSTWVNPVLRVRHAFLKLETPVVDVLLGQTWSLFGMQPTYLVTSVQEPGLPGQMFARTPQVRVSKTIKTDAVTIELAAGAMRPPQKDSETPEGVAALRLAANRWTGLHTMYMTSTSIMPASIAVSADLRQIAAAEFAVAANQRAEHRKVGGGIAVDAYLPVIPATKDDKSNALSLIGEFVTGSGISDMYTALGAAGTANAAIAPATQGGTPGDYASNFDPGLAAYDANGNLELIKWTTYMAGVEYYPPSVDGRIGLFANYGHSESPNARSFGAVTKVRRSEDYFNAGAFADPTRATRIGLDWALYDDCYADGTHAKNHAVQMSAFLFF